MKNISIVAALSALFLVACAPGVNATAGDVLDNVEVSTDGKMVEMKMNEI